MPVIFLFLHGRVYNILQCNENFYSDPTYSGSQIFNNNYQNYEIMILTEIKSVKVHNTADNNTWTFLTLPFILL